MSENNNGLDGIQAPKLDDDFYAPPVKEPNLADRLNGISAPKLDDTPYTAPQKPRPQNELPKASAAILEDTPQANQQYTPKYVDPDLEKAKKEALNRSIKSALEEKPDDFDQEKSRAMYRELMRERESEKAKKGAKLIILVMIIGFVTGAVLFALGSLSAAYGATEFIKGLGGATHYYSILLMAFAILSIFRVEKVRGFASFLFGFTVLLTLIFGLIMLLNVPGKIGFAAILFGVTIGGSILTCYMLSANECIRKYYAKKEFEW